jgi:hypothetical protein
MKSLAKSDATLRDLKEVLERRLARYESLDTIREARDADGWPMLFLSAAGDESAEEPVIAIRMKSFDAVSKDVFGNDLVAFTPHTLEVATEADSGVDMADYAETVTECAKRGVLVQIKETAAQTAVTATSMDAAEPSREIEVQDEWPTKGA